MKRQYFNDHGQAIHYERSTYTRTSEADYDEWSTVPVGWAEVVDAPTVGDLEGEFPWTFETIEGVVDEAKLAHDAHDHMGEMFHLVMLRAGA